jgi:SAM-dependent methyltransferase
VKDASREPGIPIPPSEMRQLIGGFEPEAFENPTGSFVFPDAPIPESAYESVFDFGCGCGRVARRLLQQEPRPSRYVGVDINGSMVHWCRENLSAVDPKFRFHHHDVYSASMAPDNSRQLTAPFEVEDSSFSLVVAISVFTHLYEEQTVHYLR